MVIKVKERSCLSLDICKKCFRFEILQACQGAYYDDNIKIQRNVNIFIENMSHVTQIYFFKILDQLSLKLLKSNQVYLKIKTFRTHQKELIRSDCLDVQAYLSLCCHEQSGWRLSYAYLQEKFFLWHDHS